MSQQARIEQITDKVKLLLKKQEQLQQDCANTKAENVELQALLKERNARVQELEEHLKILKLAKTVSGTEDGNGEEKAELKRKINEFIKEIDKCVALLNN